MKNKYNLLTIFVLMSLFISAQEVVWTNDTSSIDDLNWIRESTLDNNNNLYIGGYFKTNSTIGSETMLSAGGLDVYVAKLNESGANLKTIQLSSLSNLFINDIYYAPDGFIYIVGNCFNDMSFGATTIYNGGSADGYMAKFDTDLNLIWLHRVVTGTTFQSLSSIVFDNANNIVISGEFKDTIHFESTSIPEVVDSSYYTKNIYVAKYDVNGNYINHTIDYGAVTSCNSYGLGVDDNNDIYLSTYFKGDVTLDGQTISNLGSEDILITKMDANLNYVWKRKIQGTGVEKTYSLGINSDAIFISGTYTSTDLSADSTETVQSLVTPSNNGGADMFTLSYDFDGNLLWSKYFGSTGTDYLYDIETNDEVTFFSGYFPATFNYDDSTIVNTTSSNNALFLIVNPSDGEIQQYYTIGEEGDDRGATINLVKNGLNNQFFATGTFKSDSIYIGNDTLRNSFYKTTSFPVAANVQDMFIARFGCKDITLDYDSIITTCPTGTNGVLQALPSDTVGIQWSYEWEGTNATGQTVDSIAGLVDAEWYYTTVTSSKGCAYNDSIQMTHKPALQASLIDTLTLNCLASTDGVAAIIPSQGNIQGDTLTSDYSYSWNDGITDSSRTDLEVGQYIVTISDLCADTTQVIDTINIGHIPTLEAHIQNQNVIVLCDTSSNGIGRVDKDFGVAPYKYVWENSSADTTSSVANDLTVGWHHVTITDFCNVPIIDSVNIVNIPTIGSQITNYQNATCANINDGSATVTVFNGIEPYVYSWSASTDTTATSNTLPGDSMIYVTVSDICHEVVDSVSLGVNPVLEISITNVQNAKCETSSDGSAQVELTNEQGTITYSWSASLSDSSIANNLPGDSMVYVSVTDICNETVVDSATIGVNPALEVNFTNTTNANCSNTNDASSEVVLLNEQGIVTYLWDASINDTNAIAANLSVGYNLVTVTDLCGPIVDSVEVISNLALQASAVAEDNKCNSDTLGEVTITTSNEFGTVVYKWANLTDTTASIDSLSAGTYYYTVTDACNDTIKDSIVVASPDAIKDSSVVTNASELGTNDGAALLIVSGGKPSYTYDWSNSAISEENSNIMAGTYYYTITDANNCTKSDSVVVEADVYDIVIFNTFTPNADNVNDVWNIKNIERFPKCKVQVFSQWGNLVFTSDGYEEPWNGTKENTGNELPAGTYYYTIDLGNDTPNKSGSVTIMK